MFNIFEYIIASANVAQPIPSLVLGVPSNLGERLGDLPAMSLEEKMEQYQKDGAQDIATFVDALPQPQQQAIM
jgi:hypothetical protein